MPTTHMNMLMFLSHRPSP